MSIVVVNKKTHLTTPNDFYIGRGSPLGNPFTHLDLGTTMAKFKCGSRIEAIEKYKTWLQERIEEDDPEVCQALNQILDAARVRDVNLVCYCFPQPCHGDTIKQLIESKL